MNNCLLKRIAILLLLMLTLSACQIGDPKLVLGVFEIGSTKMQPIHVTFAILHDSNFTSMMVAEYMLFFNASAFTFPPYFMADGWVQHP